MLSVEEGNLVLRDSKLIRVLKRVLLKTCTYFAQFSNDPVTRWRSFSAAQLRFARETRKSAFVLDEGQDRRGRCVVDAAPACWPTARAPAAQEAVWRVEGSRFFESSTGGPVSSGVHDATGGEAGAAAGAAAPPWWTKPKV